MKISLILAIVLLLTMGEYCGAGPATWIVYKRSRLLGARPENRGWSGGFYSSGGAYGAVDFGYGHGPSGYGPAGRRTRTRRNPGP